MGRGGARRRRRPGRHDPAGAAGLVLVAAATPSYGAVGLVAAVLIVAVGVAGTAARLLIPQRAARAGGLTVHRSAWASSAR